MKSLSECTVISCSMEKQQIYEFSIKEKSTWLSVWEGRTQKYRFGGVHVKSLRVLIEVCTDGEIMNQCPAVRTGNGERILRRERRVSVAQISSCYNTVYQTYVSQYTVPHLM